MSQLTQHAGMYLGSQRPEERQRRYVPAIVHILDGQTDQIVQTLDNSMDSYDTTDDEQAVVSLFWDDEHKYTLKSGGHFDFKTTYNNSDPIQGRNRVVIPSEGGDFFHEFIIDETIKDKDVKEVYSTPSELDLRKAKAIDPFDFDNYTLPIAANTALGGTEWALGIVETDGVRSISISSYTNPYSVLKRIATTWEVEIRFRVEVWGHKIVGRYVDFLQNRGVWRGKEITLGKDLIGVKRTENAENVVTALKVIGPEQEDKKGNNTRTVVEVVDEEARQRWSRTGAHLWDVHEPETEEEDLSESRLETIGRTELNKRRAAAVEYETETVSLEHVFGLDHEVVRVGDTVRVKDTSYQPALYMEARIYEITRALTDPSQKKYKLGEYVEYEAEDVEAMQRKLRARIARKIGRDTLERYAEKKKYKGDTEPDDTEVIWVDTSVEPNVVRTYNGTRWVKATPTRAGEVNAYDRSEVRQRIEDAKAAINTAAENYAMQYSESYYEDNITSAVQEAKTYTDEEIGATSSTLQGAIDAKANEVDVNEALSGKVSVTEYSDDYNGLDGRISNNTTKVGQNEQEISLQAQELTQIENDLSSAKTEISALADEVEIRATTTEVNAIDGRLSEAEAIISAQADEIELKVNVDNVISRINLSDESVMIEGNRIEINGETFIADAVITNAMIDSLHGGKIQAETITSTALAVQYLSSITADLGVVNAGELNAVNIYGSSMTMSDDDYETTIQDGNVRSTFYRNDGRMDRAMLEPGLLYLANTDSVGADAQERIRITPTEIFAAPELTIDANLQLTGSVIQLGDGTKIDNSGGNVRIQSNLDQYLNYFFVSASQPEASLYLNSEREFRFIHDTSSNGGQMISFGDQVRLKSAVFHEIQVRRAGDDGYGDIVAADFVVGSDRNTKDHIQPWTTSVLDRIQSTQVYTYTLKGKQYESLPARYHLGLMHDEMPSIVQQSDETLNMYALVAYLWRGLQEEAEARQNVEQRLEALEDVS